MISSATRLQGIFFWDLVIYLIEGMLFLLTGFEMRALYKKSKAIPIDEILSVTALVAVIVILARFVWVFPATYLPRWLIRKVRERDPYPPWRTTFIVAFTGVRGAVSLAAALALPYALPNGDPFPYRDLVLFVAFGVIFVTLVGLGCACRRWCDGRGLRRTAAASTSPSTKLRSPQGATRSPPRCPRSTP